MKKFIAVTVIAAILFSAITGCKNESENEETTTMVVTTEEATSEATTAEPMTDEETTEESTTEKPIEYVKSGKIRIDDGKYRYTIEKKPFEDNYSKEFLMEITKLTPMEYGVDDYDKWNGIPNEILNDAFFSMDRWLLERYEYESKEWNAAVAEMKENEHSINLGEYSFTSVSKINSYLQSVYGPDVRKFTADDFETYNDVITSEESVFENYDFNFRYAYLPKTDIVVCFANEICFGGGAACYIYDIETVEDAYIVKAITGSEDYGQNVFSFEGIQGDALDMFNSYTYGRMFNYIFTLAADENGNMYMKSVDKSYILPENVKMNYIVTSDEHVNVEAKKYYTSEWETIDTLNEGEEVYSSDYYYEEDYVWISTEKYEGRVAKKYLTEIE